MSGTSILKNTFTASRRSAQENSQSIPSYLSPTFMTQCMLKSRDFKIEKGHLLHVDDKRGKFESKWTKKIRR